MTEILNMINQKYYLPHINSFIFSYLGKNPVAVLIDNYFEELKNDLDYDPMNCRVCGRQEATEYQKYNASGEMLKMCEYCYAEELGVDVYTCDDCGEKTYTYGRHTNTQGGLYCSGCMENRDENGTIIYDEEYDWNDE
jgi:hypothetical protein